VTLCGYCLVALRVAMTYGVFISVGLGGGLDLECSSTVMLGNVIVRGERGP
jgi:hypothetical protein